jgi:MFS family permease
MASYFFGVYNTAQEVHLYPILYSLSLIFGSLPGCVVGAYIGDKYEKKTYLIKGYVAAFGVFVSLLLSCVIYFVGVSFNVAIIALFLNGFFSQLSATQGMSMINKIFPSDI